MASRFLLLALGSLLTLSLVAQVPAPAPVPPPTVTVRTSVYHLDPKTGKSEGLTWSPSVSVISGSEARVSVAGGLERPKDPKSQPQGGMEMVIAPTVQPDGTVTISLRVVISNKPEPDDPKAEKRERRRDSKAHDGTLTFYSVLAKDGLFSIQDSKGGRRWYKLGAVIEGWTLLSYFQEKELLVVGQGATHQELRLYKPAIEASASELSTVVTVRPGEVTKVPGVGGLEVSVSANVSATPVAR